MRQRAQQARATAARSSPGPSRQLRPAHCGPSPPIAAAVMALNDERKSERHGESLELLGVAEAAELLGISKAVLCARRQRRCQPGDALPAFPAPLQMLKCGTIWLRTEVEAYQREAERLASLSWLERRYGDEDDPLARAIADRRRLEERR